MFASKKLSPQETCLILNCRRLPGRIDTGTTAALLGCSEHDIAPLLVARMLKPLGEPVANAPKYFSSANIETLAADPEWLAKMTRALRKYWREKNERKGGATR